MNENTQNSRPRLLVDADACPVKAECERVAERHRIEMILVSNGGIRPSRNPLIKIVIVPPEPDAADDWIAENARARAEREEGAAGLIGRNARGRLGRRRFSGKRAERTQMELEMKAFEAQMAAVAMMVMG